MTRFRRDRAAAAVAAAEVENDAAVCQAAGVDPRTLQRWRARADVDPAFKALVVEELARITGRWRERLPTALEDVERAIQRFAAKPDHDVSELDALVRAGRLLAEIQGFDRILTARMQQGVELLEEPHPAAARPYSVLPVPAEPEDGDPEPAAFTLVD